MEFLFFWLCLSVLVAVYAHRKGHNAGLYFLFALVASPLIGCVLVLCLPTNVKAVEQAKIQAGDNKKCPYCAEIIKAEANVCRFCGRDMPTRTVTTSVRPPMTVRDIFLLVGGEERGPFNQPQILEMWNLGTIDDKSLYWREGMPDWNHVTELI